MRFRADVMGVDRLENRTEKKEHMHCFVSSIGKNVDTFYFRLDDHDLWG